MPFKLNIATMGVTRLKRKDRKNKARANNRVARIKQLLLTPVIKNVDMDELRAQFGEAPKNKPAETAAQPEEASAE
ncbi:hypothetical protein MKJ04_17335 [Pontibacter sp. E15-1]|uniref:hypothetical protein n=1 Tax=Pontibacter sp. E15-1 TaxID=2919918 RepID=UPI001F4F1642|nr:hypothetical protein [Pontibacter sp. E15-1]MCJ8166612.1 hypothetical protein [Pontibacter sp. E15-1]